jgi:asparagine synthase (glutamine-hydrolysing)
MCGFTGFIDIDQSPEEHLACLLRMLCAIGHRGPDESGYYVDDRVAIGAVRLAIIDVPLGKQPMGTPDGRHWLGFNGEIFNYLELRSELESLGHRFRTNSDTEVLLNTLVQWDLDGLRRLNGQFGFVFYDRRRARLVLGRDPFGERPVFYATVNGGLAFASEVKGILALPFVERALSLRSLRHTCRFWAPLPAETCLKGVHALPPGHYAVFCEGRLATAAHYGLPPAARGRAAGLEEMKRATREVIEDSVKLRLRSDFAVGAFLSGGLDSAIVARTAAEQTREPLSTFSLEFDGGDLDESPFQRRLVAELGADHTAIRVTPGDIREHFPAVVRQAEMPVFRTAPVASYLLARGAHEADMRVVLAGDGADEVFIGYDIAKQAAFLSVMDGLPDEAAGVDWLRARLSDYLRTTDVDFPALVQALSDVPRSPFAALGAHLLRFDSEARNGDFLVDAEGGPDDRACLLSAVRALDPGFDARSTVERSLVIDMTTLLCGYGLPCQLDRVGTLTALEVRLPFLDTRVTELAWSMPEELRLRDGGVEKFILREAFAKQLPREVAARPKQAMRAPGPEALRRLPASEDWVAETLSSDRLARSEVVDAGRARRLLERVHAHGDRIPYPDTHAYLLLLSTLLLEDALVHDFVVPEPQKSARLVRCVDERGRAAVLA